MKFILLSDISYFFKSKKKIIFLYLLILFTYFLFNIIFKFPMDNKLFYKTLTLNCEFETADWMNIIMYLFSLSVYGYVALLLFTKDLKNGLYNIFLRMNSTKWILYKIISTSLISIIMLILAYLTIFIPFLISSISIEINIIFFAKNLFFILLLQHISLLLFVVFSKMKIILPTIILLTLININNIPTNIINMNFTILMILFVLAHVLLITFFHYLFVSVFENN